MGGGVLLVRADGALMRPLLLIVAALLLLVAACDPSAGELDVVCTA